jgi:hypothetical protein
MQNEERINVLETQVRTLKRIVCLICSLLVAGVVVSATQEIEPLQGVPYVIQARSFEVVNADGIALVRLGVTKNGQGMIRTMNGGGQDLVRLGVTASGKGVVRTMNGMGQELVQLGVNTDGQGTITTKNGKGQRLVRLGVSDSGRQGTVWTYDENGVSNASLH